MNRFKHISTVSAVVSLLQLVLLAGAIGQERKDVDAVYLIEEGPGNEVKTIVWNKDLTLARVLIRRSTGFFRLPVQLYSRGTRRNFTSDELDHEEVVNLMTHPGDVIVVGLVDENRRRQLEQIPVVANALAPSAEPRHTKEQRSEHPLPSSATEAKPAGSIRSTKPESRFSLIQLGWLALALVAAGCLLWCLRKFR